MKMGNLSAAYAEADAAWKQKEQKIRARRERARRTEARAEADLAKLWQRHQSWVDVLVRPIADAIAERMPDRIVDVLGPFGLAAEVAIHATLRTAVGKPGRFDGDNTLSLSFRPDDLDEGKLGLVDRSKNTGRFPPGSLGEMNSLNWPTTPVPDDADVDWFVERLA